MLASRRDGFAGSGMNAIRMVAMILRLDQCDVYNSCFSFDGFAVVAQRIAWPRWLRWSMASMASVVASMASMALMMASVAFGLLGDDLRGFDFNKTAVKKSWYTAGMIVWITQQK